MTQSIAQKFDTNSENKIMKISLFIWHYERPNERQALLWAARCLSA